MSENMNLLSRRRFLSSSGATAAIASMPAIVLDTAAALPPEIDLLVAGFRKPTDSARPLTIWQWMNGCVSREGITADLEAFKEAGLGGVQQFMIGGEQAPLDDPTVKILNPKWCALMRFAMQECKRLGLSFGTHNSPGWDASAGNWVTAELSMQKLVWTSTTVGGYIPFGGTLPRPEIDAKWDYYRDVAVLAVPDGQGFAPSAVIDLSARMSADGAIRWDAPAGKWSILRFGHTTNGKTNEGTAPLSGSGLHCDMMSREAVEAFWRGYPTEIVKLAGTMGGTTFTRFEIDSYEAGRQDWTPRMLEEFRHRRGYDLLPWLPALAGRTVGDPERTQRFKYDWSRTIADLFADNYYGFMTLLAEQTPGLEMMIEPYATGAGAPFDSLAVGNKGHAVMCEFWQAPAEWGWDSVKPVASAAHRSGKALVYAEAFTGQPPYAWRQDPYALKATGDRAFCAGVNLFAFHATAHNPWPRMKPGMTMGWWGTQFGPGQTWWEHGGPEWIAYLSRCQFMLQQGMFAADLCYLLNESGTPKMPRGFEGDIVGERDAFSLDVQDGRVGYPGGSRYSVLILPDSTVMSAKLARKIQQLAQAGATIIGPRPTRTPGLEQYPRGEEELRQIAEVLWGETPAGTRAVGNGQVVWGKDIASALAELGFAPDVQIEDTQPLLWTHRSHPQGEIYFLSNQTDTGISTSVSFRQSGLKPELWHPDSGAVTRITEWSDTGGRTKVPFELAPSGSIFVVFRKSATAQSTMPVVTVERSRLPLADRWTVSFPTNSGAPSQITLDQLQSWSDHPDPGVKHFSGTAVYRTHVDLPADLPPGRSVALDLGVVKNIATIVVNGIEFPTLWKPPFSANISSALKRGVNQVEVRVTNLWPNRLIGDEQLPDDCEWGEPRKWTFSKPPMEAGRPLVKIPEWLAKNKPRPTERKSFTTFKFFSKDDALVASGILGPATLVISAPSATSRAKEKWPS